MPSTHHSNYQKRAPKGHPVGGQWQDEGKLNKAEEAARKAAGLKSNNQNKPISDSKRAEELLRSSGWEPTGNRDGSYIDFGHPKHGDDVITKNKRGWWVHRHYSSEDPLPGGGKRLIMTWGSAERLEAYLKSLKGH